MGIDRLRRLAQAGIPDVPASFPDPRQHQIWDDGVSAALKGNAQGRLAVPGSADVITRDPETVQGAEPEASIVFNHQFAIGHRRSEQPAVRDGGREVFGSAKGTWGQDERPARETRRICIRLGQTSAGDRAVSAAPKRANRIPKCLSGSKDKAICQSTVSAGPRRSDPLLGRERAHPARWPVHGFEASTTPGHEGPFRLESSILVIEIHPLRLATRRRLPFGAALLTEWAPSKALGPRGKSSAGPSRRNCINVF